jgi:hypothetical protein
MRQGREKRDAAGDAMKRRQIGWLLSVGIVAVRLSNGSAFADDTKAFTCKVHGGSFALDDTDFKALASVGITREKFAAFPPKDRVSVCDARMVARLVKSGKADECAFDQYDYQVVTAYLDKSERTAALKAAETPHAGKCR